LEDRRHFFEGDADDDNMEVSRDEEVLLWLSVNDLHKPINDTQDKSTKSLKSEEETKTKQSDDGTSQHIKNQLDIVAEKGRLLLSSSGEQYDDDWDGESSEYIREQEALHNLDATAVKESSTTHEQVDETKKEELQQQSFLMKRVALQRKILARRLGLSGILSAPIVAGDDDQVLVKDDDLIPAKKNEEQTSSKATKVNKKKAGKKSKKRRRDEPEEHTKKAPAISIRALLVLESKRSTTEANGSTTSRRARHRNPQTLLGSELAYRTFDPDWTVRHGALLGTLALLRAWKVHQSLPNRAQDNNNNNKKKFGRWPQDILARCVCILSLDQFADFSGTDYSQVDNNNDSNDNDMDDIISGAIIAPVREMAAQIIAILLEAADTKTIASTHDLLLQLFTQQYRITETMRRNSGWEIRHGVLLAWKYNIAMLLFHSSNRNGQTIDIETHIRPLSLQLTTTDHTKHESPFNKIIFQSIRGLSDASDDNRAGAAQVLRHSLLIDASHHDIGIIRECSKPLWDAIMSIRAGLSSCAPDLLNLLADLLTLDCTEFITSLQEGQASHSLGSLLQRLSFFIDDDSNNIKISCFQALRLVAPSIVSAFLEPDYHQVNCTGPLCYILNKLYETFFMSKYIHKRDGNDSDSSDPARGELLNKRNQAWHAILDALAMLTQSNGTKAVIDDYFTTMTLRYFCIIRLDNSLSRIPVSSGVTGHDSELDNTFISKLTSAQALSEFYAKIYARERPTILSSLIHLTIQSPWLCQCEAGYLLHICITSLTKTEEHINHDNHSVIQYLPHMINTFERPPICILLEDHEVLDDIRVQALCDNGLALLLDSSKNCTSKEVVQLWQQVFAQNGISFDELHKSSNQLSLTKASMRLSATISGALVACGAQNLPPKVTPLIRALMTSLKNEESQPRRAETCKYIAKLVSILSDNPTHEKATNKLIDNVCAMACSRDVKSSCQSKAAESVIKLLVRGSAQKLEDLSPIWSRLSPLLNDDISQEEELHDSICMLEIISKAMSKDCPSFMIVLDSFITSTVHVVCKSDDDEVLMDQACASINNLCTIDFCATMDKVIPCLQPMLSNIQDDQGREGGCKLLMSILHDFEVLVAPYVTTLLPIAMRLMTDKVEECSRIAASAFAILVRIAPLAASHIDKGDSSTSEDDHNVSNNVIRHLILGKPLPPVTLPKTVLSHLQKSGTTLRPYQMEGMSWLNFLTEVHLNGALCDDMGLGKTLQALIAVAIFHHKSAANNKAKSLVICPSSVVGHWVSEIERFFPGEEVFTAFDFTGSPKTRRSAWQTQLNKSNIVVTSYSILRNDINLLENVLWNWCILDEGHLLKNPKTATAKASRRLKAQHKLILTGTPIQNNVNEIWATFDFLMPNFLGSNAQFLKEFAKPIIKSQSSDASATDIHQGMECLKLLHQQVLPFVLRREKSQVIKELPPKIITDVPCLLSRQQHLMYQETLKQSGMKEALDLVDKSLVDTEDQSSDDVKSPSKLGSNVLTSLLQLRLICTHPLLHSLFSSKSNTTSKRLTTDSISPSFTRLDCSGKLSALNDILRHAGIAEAEITAADNDESGFLVDMNDSLSDTNSNELDFLETDDTYDEAVADSPELVASNSSKCLIFAQFTQSLDIVERLLFEPHMPSLQYLRLDGRVPSNQRNSIVDQFNQDANVKVLLLTTKVGGLGLNLTGKICRSLDTIISSLQLNIVHSSLKLYTQRCR